ncbi:hypothetical protein OS493_039364 [Desmophyllum pertusum]|uniref:Uncharacterized protein n=1 Tax=Desmophyllum pertusum TaxID=174260 RepID=A0A9W9YIQ1_9CNID|nr:hypothetical protein OS493_039364 [Desmophyllum pertusum]
MCIVITITALHSFGCPNQGIMVDFYHEDNKTTPLEVLLDLRCQRWLLASKGYLERHPVRYIWAIRYLNSASGLVADALMPKTFNICRHPPMTTAWVTRFAEGL